MDCINQVRQQHSDFVTLSPAKNCLRLVREQHLRVYLGARPRPLILVVSVCITNSCYNYWLFQITNSSDYPPSLTSIICAQTQVADCPRQPGDQQSTMKILLTLSSTLQLIFICHIRNYRRSNVTE